MNVRIGFTPGLFSAEDDHPQGLRRLVVLADELGYDSIWLSDRLVGNHFPLEPIVALAMVAAYSDRLKFGTGVLDLPLRDPVLLAKQLATLDALSHGRLFPAVGVGQGDPVEHEAVGVPVEARGARADEAIALMRRLWQEERVTHEGRFFTVRGVSLHPRPAQRPCPPLWIGGRSVAAQRRVGRLGDGWLVSQATPPEIDAGREVIFATAAAHARTVPADHLGVMLGFCLADSPQQAMQVAEPLLGRSRADIPADQYCALGPPEIIAERIRAYVAAGASKFVVRPLCPPAEAADQLEAFGRQVLPQFHA